MRHIILTSLSSFIMVLFCSSIWDTFLYLILSNFLCFYVLVMSVMSSNLETSDLTRKMSHGILYITMFPIHQNQELQRCVLWGLYVPYNCV